MLLWAMHIMREALGVPAALTRNAASRRWRSARHRTKKYGSIVRAYLLLELELIQPHMAQKPMLRGEVQCETWAMNTAREALGVTQRWRGAPACFCGLGAS